ncbi:hypothetical protein [Thalassotalea sp. ND16A]|uniref:hypothetical protein n=1 Tax=Thalassotalea sp. ND16A TaxID=1535422 RepID=UPI00126A4D76|nr:hypothetical protein [Thalassotalea sp. ND16A]
MERLYRSALSNFIESLVDLSDNQTMTERMIEPIGISSHRISATTLLPFTPVLMAKPVNKNACEVTYQVIL